jgi:biotin synthase
MLTDAQAAALAEAGLTAYNHNLDTSREFYGQVVSTRTYEDRLDTLARIQRAGIQVCSGGIIGLGETVDDRCAMLATLAAIDPHPDSVPVNALVPVPGTPLGARPRVDPIELVRVIATARILMPRSTVRLSAGRSELSDEAHALCFLAGANSIFYGDKLLTTGNPDTDHDRRLLEKTGMRGRPAPARA